MHPNPKFRWDKADEMRAFVQQAGFAQIIVAAEGRPLTAQAPVVIAPDGSVRFHLARANPLVPLLDGTPVLASVTGRHFYVSPDWYGTDDQVPTWNYCFVEIEGVARRLEEPDLRKLLDQLSAAQEAQLAPKPAWTAAKMDQDKLGMMLRAIVGFTVDAPVFSGRIKMSQNKSEAERRGTIAALRTLGRHEDADAIEAML